MACHRACVGEVVGASPADGHMEVDKNTGDMWMEHLKGQQVEAIYLADWEALVPLSPNRGNDALLGFKVKNRQNVFWYEALPDCCDSTWFNDVLGVDALIGYPVLRLEEVSLPEVRLPDLQPNGGHDVLRTYAINIYTLRGMGTVMVRNQSNGFYVGRVELIEEPTYLNGPVRRLVNVRAIEHDYPEHTGRLLPEPEWPLLTTHCKPA